MHTTLLIMAAGMGSRFGGNKQMARLGPNGEILLQYALFDAAKAGFDKVVFVIKRAMQDEFAALLQGAIPAQMTVETVFQEYDTLPGGFVPPEGRAKPYGTVHAVLAAKDVIHEPFAVINADDYYGPEAFKMMAQCLRGLRGCTKAASMVAYRLHNTISENGTVTRGVCEQDENACLRSVRETYGVMADEAGVIRDENGAELPGDALVSMNFWGLTPCFFQEAEARLAAFLQADAGDPMKKEFVLPALIDTLMHEAGWQVQVLSTRAVWFGVTYPADRPQVMAQLRRLHAEGVYPATLNP